MVLCMMTVTVLDIDPHPTPTCNTTYLASVGLQLTTLQLTTTLPSLDTCLEVRHNIYLYIYFNKAQLVNDCCQLTIR